MNYRKLIDGMKRFGSTESDICIHGTGISSEKINENVVIAPWWEPAALPGLGEARYLSDSDSSAVKVWNISNQDSDITYIKTGIGAPVLMDALLSLGVTKCKRVIFVGSVGSLDENIGIGDIVIPKYSICGDGASRYISTDSLKSGDRFGDKTYPDKELFSKICNITEQICTDNEVKYHIGKNFSIDTIFAQFAHIDEIRNMDCNVIEMETAAAFRAARLANISLAAIFSVSDNTVVNKSLVSGRTEKEREYHRFTKKSIFPQIIHKTFQDVKKQSVYKDFTHKI